jgi:hypothetical protein
MIVMTRLRRSFSAFVPLLLLVSSACGGDSPTPVAALSSGDAQALCRQFFTAACTAGLAAKGDRACNGCDPCTQSSSLATIRSACGDGITDASVHDCISSGFDMPTCTGPERGGCMFDVGDMLCPSTAAF